MTTEYDLLVVGDVNVDLIVSGDDPVPQFGQVEKLVDDAVLTIGGSSAITACAAARLGLRTAIVGVVGDDALGRWMREALEERGVDPLGCRVDSRRRTGVTVVLSDRTKGDRAMLSAMGTAATLTADGVDRSLLKRARHVHSGAFFLQPLLQPGLGPLFAEARSLGATCSLDTNWDPTGRWDGGLDSALAACDVFLPNEAEALAVSGCTTVEDAATRLLQRGSTVVAVKRGSGGGLVRSGERVCCVRSPQAPVLDTTGAGDVFDAAFIYGFVNGWDAARCLALAVAAGSLSTRAMGGVDGQPDLGEAQALASELEVRWS